MRRTLIARFGLLAAALSLSACQSPDLPAGSTSYSVAEGFDSRRPADVGVLAPAGGIPADAARDLRESCRSLLLGRRYAPVRTEEVDRDPKAFRAGGPNAVLEVRVTRWDTGRIAADGTVVASAEARLYRPGSAEPLYRAVVRDFPVRAPAPPASMEDRSTAAAAAAAALADLLLARLPAKGDG